MPNQWSDRVSVQPVREPASLEDVRRNLDLDDSYRDADLSMWLTEARKQVEHDARTALITQTHITDAKGWGDICTLPAVWPVIAVSAITYEDTNGDTQTLATTVYGVDVNQRPARIYLKREQTWPVLYGEHMDVHVTYTCGYGATPADVPGAARSAIFMLIRHRFDQPGVLVPAGMSETPEGYASAINQLRGGDYP